MNAEGEKSCIKYESLDPGPDRIPLVAFGLTSIFLVGWTVAILFFKTDPFEEVDWFRFTNFKEIGYFTSWCVNAALFPLMCILWPLASIKDDNMRLAFYIWAQVIWWAMVTVYWAGPVI